MRGTSPLPDAQVPPLPIGFDPRDVTPLRQMNGVASETPASFKVSIGFRDCADRRNFLHVEATPGRPGSSRAQLDTAVAGGRPGGRPGHTVRAMNARRWSRHCRRQWPDL